MHALYTWPYLQSGREERGQRRGMGSNQGGGRGAGRAWREAWGCGRMVLACRKGENEQKPTRA